MPRESQADKSARTQRILQRLESEYPQSRISLRAEDPFQLLVSVILSAQCTDAVVNQVTPALFRRYPTVQAFAAADLPTLQRLIRPTGYFRNKARALRAAARHLLRHHDGHVPDTMDALDAIPGVARKTANVVLWNAFHKTEGIAVDTHVTRIANLLRLTRSTDPVRIEQDLVRLVPQEAWGHVTHLVIDHGRAVCIARRPRCEACVLNDLCPSALRPLQPRNA